LKKKFVETERARFSVRYVAVLGWCCLWGAVTVHSAPIADGCEKFLGNISTAAPPSNFLDYWNQVTLENNGKWANIEPNRDQMNWKPVKDAYDFCLKNKIPYKHHTFLWNEQYPAWMDGLSPADQKAEVEELIRLFGEKFPETAYIDVINESREKAPKWRNALGGAGETGYDWIVWAFETTKKYCPKAKLFVNEYYCEYNLDYVTEYLKIVNVLKERNLIDGIGLQTHDGETKKGFEMGTLKKCLDSLATSGVPLYSTELDLSGSDAEQLKWYQDIFPIIWEHPAVNGVTLWGWTDSWLLHLSNPKDARLIINGRERPALKWLREYVKEHKDVVAVNTGLAIYPTSPGAIPFPVSGGLDGAYGIPVTAAGGAAVRLRIFDVMGRCLFSGCNRSGFAPAVNAISRNGRPCGSVIVKMGGSGRSGVLQQITVR
jgi:endo-1,4-beta-xylanase